MLLVLAAVTERIQPEDRVALGNGRAITTPELAATPKQAADRHGPVARVLAGLLETHSPTPAQDFSRVLLISTLNALGAALLGDNAMGSLRGTQMTKLATTQEQSGASRELARVCGR